MPDNRGPGASHDEKRDSYRTLRGLGYLVHDHPTILGYTHSPNPGWNAIEEGDEEQSKELKSALCLLLEFERHIDYLVNNWLNRKHHQQSYALNPDTFKTKYKRWRNTPRHEVTAGFTSLTLRICACSLDFIDEDRATELNVTNVRGLTDQVYTAAKNLAIVFRQEKAAWHSMAAVIQSGIGNVVGGSAFAACQSAAAGGAGAAAVNGVVAGTGAAVSAVAAGGRFLVSRLGRVVS
ncbi:uncharacterized protein C8A04DRAFT_32859 [Dichotomopilus funicola]|uniref:Uncharacterized protein n=1 Tax=Dichotomopilus funicola TaxID=1934379 RepID=A0AAN6UW57_9PEZI|nr:hypothetical protein C8A04DRAFT_32859 [Dichotomopilus funicola]